MFRSWVQSPSPAPKIMDNYQAYELLSAAYRKHLKIEARAVTFSTAIAERIEAIQNGAEKRDPTELGLVCAKVLKENPRYAECIFFKYCVTLIKAEEQV